MPAFRIGFGSDFTLANQLVGVGTTTATRRLEVDGGTLKGDFNITGVSTLTVYGGFVGQKQNVSVASTIGFSTSGVGTFVQVTESETGYLSLVGEYNTVSEDIIVDEGRIFEVSVGSTVSPGTLESISIQSHFSVPNGGISSRPNQPTEGMVRFNDDLNTLEFYNGIEWRQFTVSGASGRALYGGGYSGGSKRYIDYITISTTGNSQRFGELTRDQNSIGACSSDTRALFGGGTNVIDYVTTASSGTAQDFGDLTVVRYSLASLSSSTRGIWGGGRNPSPGVETNVVDYVQISTIGNALDFGDLVFSGRYIASCASPTRGIFAGGDAASGSNVIQFITISSTGNTSDFGDLTAIKKTMGGLSNSTRGLFGGGNNPTANFNTIDSITIASTGNATEFGSLTVTRSPSFGSAASSTRGVFTGGYGPTPLRNTLDYVQIATSGNAQDFGDLQATSYACSTCSDSHGGLGGF